MGCSNSKQPIKGDGELTFPVNGPPPSTGSGNRMNGASLRGSQQTPQPPTPIWTTQDILRIGNAGENHDAMVAYSMNARNGYGVQNVYDLGEFLGKGAFGEIYKVNHKLGGQGGEELALKYVRPVEILQHVPLNTYDDITYRVGEIRSLLLLRNIPGILQIREFYFNFLDIHTKPLALVTEMMKGEDLDKWMKNRVNTAEGVTEATASDIARSLLSAIRHMHDRRIVHRDLKVSNLRVTNPLDPSSIKVYDFGLARVLNEGEFANEDCGSLGYTAPELLSRQPYGVEVDMFSAGVIVFFVLSGYRPFNVPGANRAEVKQKIINCEYTMDQTRWNRVSSQAQVLVRSLLVPRDSEYQRRLTAPEALEHEWLREDEATRINLTRYDLNQNATYIETGQELEPLLSQHSIQSTMPGPRVDVNVRNIVSQIRLEQTGLHSFDFLVSETSLSCTPPGAVFLVDYVVQYNEDYTERKCRHLFFKIFKAVHALHQRNVVHRSIRREHIFVQPGPDGNPKILIGGMHNARVMENGNPLTGNCGTSLVATAPEVYRAIAYDSAVDSWALGVLLYEFVTGLFPFRGRGRRLREEIARASVKFDDFYPGSPDSRDLILALIRANPRDRYTLSDALRHGWFQSPVTGDLNLAKVFLGEEGRQP